MVSHNSRPDRRIEIEEIVERKEGVEEVRDKGNRFTTLGPSTKSTYTNWITPIEKHFICHRNPIPDIDTDTWTVGIRNGDESTTLSMADIRDNYATVNVPHVMECAGNGRKQHSPETRGVQWDYEAAANAVWTGTPLDQILQEIGVSSGDEQWLTVIGGDSTDERPFVRSIPLQKALEDCILAYRMNGEQLPEEHGKPIRLIVPGWYGVNNVKWVRQIHITDSMVTENSLYHSGNEAKWQQVGYRLNPTGEKSVEHGHIETTDTRKQIENHNTPNPYTFNHLPMSLIGFPLGDSPLKRNKITIEGVAWTGDAGISTVEISTDGGESWTDASLTNHDYIGAWYKFTLDWRPSTGKHTLCSRATDEDGYRQPRTISDPGEWQTATENDQFPYNEGGFLANAYLPNAVTVTT